MDAQGFNEPTGNVRVLRGPLEVQRASNEARDMYVALVTAQGSHPDVATWSLIQRWWPYATPKRRERSA